MMYVVGFHVVDDPLGVVMVTGLFVVTVMGVILISFVNGSLSVVVVIFIVITCIVVH